MNSTVFMYSGQGSQYYHMGRALYDRNRVFHESMNELDYIAQKLLGRSVIKTLYSAVHDKGDLFNSIMMTHPAIFMVEYSLTQTLTRIGICPDIVLGVSLGSFAAAAVAGFISVKDALEAVIQQAITIEGNCEPGGMIAVLNDPALFAEDFLCSHSELVAVNFSSHFVVSARSEELRTIEIALKKRNINYQLLPVSFPFHSKWIDRARVPFESFMRSIQFKQGRLPLACCTYSSLLSDLPDDYFWNVVRHPIRLGETIALLEQKSTCRYIDVGPVGTLATFLNYLIPAASPSTVHTILSPYGFEERNLNALSELT